MSRASELKQSDLIEKKKKKVKPSSNPWERNAPRQHPLLIVKNWVDGIVKNAYFKTEYEWSPTIFHWLWYCAVYGVALTFGLLVYVTYGLFWLALVFGPLIAIVEFGTDGKYLAAVGCFFVGVIIWTMMARLEMFSGDWAIRNRW